MYSSIYTDWQWPSKRTLMLLPLNLLESAVIQWSVCLNSLWLYCSPFFESLLLIRISFLSFIFFSPSLTALEPHPPNSLKTAPGRSCCLKIGSAGELMEKHMHWNIVGAKTITHPPRRVPTSIGSHETPPQNTEVGTPLISTHPVVCDNKQQHGNVNSAQNSPWQQKMYN